MRASDTGNPHSEFHIPNSAKSPYLRAGYGHGEAVPEAAVDEDGDLSAGVGDIRAAGCFFVMDPIPAAAGGPKRPAEKKLRARVAAAVGAHHPRRGLALRHRRSLVSDVHR